MKRPATLKKHTTQMALFVEMCQSAVPHPPAPHIPTDAVDLLGVHHSIESHPWHVVCPSVQPVYPTIYIMCNDTLQGKVSYAMITISNWTDLSRFVAKSITTWLQNVSAIKAFVIHLQNKITQFNFIKQHSNELCCMTLQRLTEHKWPHATRVHAKFVIFVDVNVSNFKVYSTAYYSNL